MFNVFLDGSLRPRKLALSDDLLMVALINTRSNKVTNAYEVTQISVTPGAHDDAREAVMGSNLCLTMACADQVFTLQALNQDLYQYWLEGIHLAQEMVMHKQTVSAFEEDIAETNNSLHTAILSQINFAFPKVFPATEESTSLTLVTENANEESTHMAESSDSEEEAAKNRLSRSIPGEQAADMPIEAAPPAALRLGRSVPRGSGYMSPSLLEGSLASSAASFAPLSPVSPRSREHTISPPPLQAAPSTTSSTVRSDSPSPTSSYHDHVLPKTTQPAPESLDVTAIMNGISLHPGTPNESQFDSIPATPESSSKVPNAGDPASQQIFDLESNRRDSLGSNSSDAQPRRDSANSNSSIDPEQQKRIVVTTLDNNSAKEEPLL